MAVVWPSKNNFANGDVLTAANMNDIGDTLNVFNPTSATNGQIWVANGSGSGAYTTVASGSLTSLASGSLSGSSLSLTSISGSYNSLLLYIRAFRPSTAATAGLRINNQTAGYFYTFSGNYNTSDRLNIYGGSKDRLFLMAETSLSSTAGQIHQAVIEIPNYTQTTDTMGIQARIYHVVTTSAGDTVSGVTLGRVTNSVNGPVTRLDFLLSAGTFSTGTYQLYGVN